MSNKDQLTATTFAFVKELRDFSYGLSVSDHVWEILFPGKGDKWHHLRIIKYKHTFYITRVDGGGGSLEVEEQQDAQLMSIRGAAAYSMENHGQLTATWETLIASAREWLKVVRKDWIKANKQIQSEYPLQYRYGVCLLYTSDAADE